MVLEEERRAEAAEAARAHDRDAVGEQVRLVHVVSREQQHAATALRLEELFSLILRCSYQKSSLPIHLLQLKYAIGSVIAGFTFAKFITKAGQQITYALTMGGNGVLLLSIVFIGDIFLIATLMMFTLGLAFNSGRVFNSSLTAMASLPEQRGVFMAVVGIYWALGVFIGPLVFGPLAEITSLALSISIAGSLMLFAAIMSPYLFKTTMQKT